MQEIVACPECRRRLQVPPEVMGQRVQCPSCATTFIAAHGPPPVVTPAPAPTGSVTVDSPGAKQVPIDIVSPDADEMPQLPSAKAKRRFRELPAPKPASSLRKVVILGAIIAFAVVLVVCITAFNTGPVGRRHNPPVPAFVPPVVNAPRMVAPKLDDAAQKEIAKALLDRLGAAVKIRDLGGSAGVFDGWRTIDELANLGILPAHVRQQNNLPNDVAFAFAGYFSSTATFWEDYVLANVRQLPNGDLVAISRHRLRNPTGGIVRLRWSLSFNANEWRFYECEEHDYGFRVSLTFDCALNTAHPVLANDLRTMRDAFKVMLDRQHFDVADKMLERVQHAGLPQQAHATYYLLRAQASNRLARDQAAFDQCDEALRLNPDLVGADYIKSISCSWLNRNDQGFTHAKKVHAMLGDDADACYVMGLALQRLFRRSEAAVFYRKSLDDDAKHFDSFVNLLNCIDSHAPNNDIGTRFQNGQKPAEKFLQCAELLWKNRNGSALISVAEAMRRIDPLHVDAEFFLALGKMNQGQADEAFKALGIAWTRQLQMDRRKYYTQEFSLAAVQADEALRAYTNMPATSNPFRTLARELRNAFRINELRELVTEYAKKKPKDAYLRLYQAEVLLQDEDFAKAKAAYAEAFAKIADLGELNPFRYNRVRASYKLGEVMQAYASISPRDQTFGDLAQMCWLDKKFGDLAKLVAEHEKDNPRDPQLPRWIWRVALERKQFDNIGALVKREFEGKNRDRYVLQNFAFDAVETGQALEGYRHMPDPSVDVEFIASELIARHKAKELRELIALHRKKFFNDRLLAGFEAKAAWMEGDTKAAAAAFAKAWPELPDEKKQHWKYDYIDAFHKLGKDVEVYRNLGSQSADFRQLATLLLAEKNIDRFEALLEAHRPQRPNDKEFDAYDARLKILRNKPNEATPLLANAWQNLDEPLRRTVLNTFVADLFANGKAMQAYTCSPDRNMAFQQICYRLRQAKQIDTLEKILMLHAVDNPASVQWMIEQGELALLKKDPGKAEELFAAVRARPEADAANARINWLRARIAGGKIEQTYRELGASQRAFRELASECSIAKNGTQLEALLRLHRQTFPGSSNYDALDIEVAWLKKDYEAVIRDIRAKRTAMLKGNKRWQMEGWLVRSCVRAKKFDDAIQEAEAITNNPSGYKTLMVLALAAKGDVKKTLEYVERNATNRYFVDGLYRDEDLGPILRGDAFRSFQDRYPAPRDTNQFRFDDDDDFR